MHIVLVRHATCAQMDDVLLGRTIDPPLDERGQAQADALAERLASWPRLVVECSPRQRTRQTAAAIARRHACEACVVPDMDEVDFGRWSGQSFAALAQDRGWRHWNEQRSRACTPAGESVATLQARAIGHLHRLRHLYPLRTVVIVTHAEIIRVVVLHCLGQSADDYHRIEIGPASLTTLSAGEAQLDVSSLNERVYA